MELAAVVSVALFVVAVVSIGRATYIRVTGEDRVGVLRARTAGDRPASVIRNRPTICLPSERRRAVMEHGTVRR